MKELLRSLIRALARNDLTFKIGEYAFRLGLLFKRERWEYEQKPDYDAISELLRKREVLFGPFKGLKYPDLKGYGSTVYPKMIGSYEDHLHPVIEKLISMDISELVSVGTAEGYFTNGFAMRLPELRVTSYEINPMARQFQKKMAGLNGLEDRIEIRELCTPEILGEIGFRRSGLLIVDCEGCEKTLFSGLNKENLKSWYIIIETHSRIDIEIPMVLKKHFADSHKIGILHSVDDGIKAELSENPLLKDLDIGTRSKLVAENRLSTQQYLILSPLNGVSLI